MMRDVIAKILSTSVAGLGAALLPSLSFGLGLGDIQVESRLNQPLYAHIEVVDVSDDDWRLIRARIAPRTLLSGGPVHPEILASLTLRAVETGKGRHFIEVKSGEVLTEPLFDLPVEVAGQSLQVVRNYSVLLDPVTGEDAPREASPAASGAAGGQYAGLGQVDAQAHAVTPHRGHRARQHSSAFRKLATAANPVGASNSLISPDAPNSSAPGNTTSAMPPRQMAAAGATRASGQEPLQGQLETLQQTLTRMQATIASQNVEIARLTAQVSARSEPPGSRRPSTWVEYPAGKSAAGSQGASDGRPGWFSARSSMFYWIGGALAGAVVLALGVVRFLRWRYARMLREIALHEAARRQPAVKPVEAPTSERDLLTWQTNLRAAQSGMWKQTLEETFDPTASASEDTVAMTIAIEELTQDLEADLESLNASYEAEYLQNTSGAGKDDTDSGFVAKVAI